MTDLEREVYEKHGKVVTAVLRRLRNTETTHKCGTNIALEWELTCKRLLGTEAYEEDRLLRHIRELKYVMEEAAVGL